MTVTGIDRFGGGMMERVQTIIYKYKRIIYIDFSNLSSFMMPEIIRVIEEAKQAIHSNPPGSVLTLTNVTSLFFNKEILDMMIRYVTDNKSYVKAGAIIGAEGLRKIAVNSAEKFSMRDLHLFDNEDEAKEWLVAQ